MKKKCDKLKKKKKITRNAIITKNERRKRFINII